MRRYRKAARIALLFMLMAVTLSGCSSHNQSESSDKASSEVTDNNKDGKEGSKMTSKLLEKKLMPYFEKLTLADSLKGFGMNNPLITQRLGADPYAVVYDGRVYMYMTGDVVEHDVDGAVTNNSFGKINTLNVISSADLVNWTDHGAIRAAGNKGAAKWGNNAWAPAVASKELDGKTKFFIYFANGGNGIGVLTSDSPTGPFTDPLGHALVSRSTPNCANVAWLFDPAVLVDDDGKAYLYFGGGIPDGKFANPGTGRIVELGDDMISLAGDPVKNEVPYLFEDSGINKIGDTYYYSYCSNWNVDPKDADKLGFNNAQIVYMTSDSPMGPFTLQSSILKNPGDFFGCYGTHHHCMFEFNDQLYIAYHSHLLEQRLDITGGYRCTHIDAVTVNEDGSIKPITATETGINQVKSLNPYEKTEAETMATMGGISTVLYDESSKNNGTGNMVVNDIHAGDWTALYGVDFGEEGANSFTASIKPPKKQFGAVQIRLDSLDGDVVGYLEIEPNETADYHEITTKLLSTVKGQHNLVFIFYGEEYTFDYWYFK